MSQCKYLIQRKAMAELVGSQLWQGLKAVLTKEGLFFTRAN